MNSGEIKVNYFIQVRLETTRKNVQQNMDKRFYNFSVSNLYNKILDNLSTLPS